MLGTDAINPVFAKHKHVEVPQTQACINTFTTFNASPQKKHLFGLKTPAFIV